MQWSIADAARLAGLELVDDAGGSPEVSIGLIDGMPDVTKLAFDGLRYTLAMDEGGRPAEHATNVLGVLGGQSAGLGLCKDCLFVIAPVLSRRASRMWPSGACTVGELAHGLIRLVRLGCSVINVSAALEGGAASDQDPLRDALGIAAEAGTLVVVAGRNRGEVGSSTLALGAWPIPVVPSDEHGVPIGNPDLGRSVGSWGVVAPGVPVATVGLDDGGAVIDGSSVAAAFVTATIARWLSATPKPSPAQVRYRLHGPSGRGSGSVVPIRLSTINSSLTRAHLGRPVRDGVVADRIENTAGTISKSAFSLGMDHNDRSDALVPTLRERSLSLSRVAL